MATQTITFTMTDVDAAALEALSGDGRTAQQIIADDVARQQDERLRVEHVAKFKAMTDLQRLEIIATYHPEPLPTLKEQS